MWQLLPLFDNEKNALNPVFCKGEAAFSHLSAGGIFGRFFKVGHLDLLHMAFSESNTFFYKLEIVLLVRYHRIQHTFKLGSELGISP